jgi:hypothetical protein
MRENTLLVSQRSSSRPGPKNHDGTIVFNNVHDMGGQGMTKAVTRDGWVFVSVTKDHYYVASIGLYGALPGTCIEYCELVI